MQVAAIQFDIVWEDKPANHAIIERLLEEASIEPGTLVVLPELADTGFSMELDAIVDDSTLTWGSTMAGRFGIWLQVGYAERDRDGFGRNCAAIIAPGGEVAGIYRKVHPFTFSREAEHYRGGADLFIHAGDEGAVCPLICYDLRFPELWRLATLAGAEVFTIGANWPAARHAHWRTLLAARAIENQAFVVAANRTGRDPHHEYAGGSVILSPQGEILAEAGAAEAVLVADLPMGDLRAWRDSFPALKDVHRDLLGSIPTDVRPESPSGNIPDESNPANCI